MSSFTRSILRWFTQSLAKEVEMGIKRWSRFSAEIDSAFF
ncbi:hypothetical protein OCAR_6405 [Afipia carboxidovorans OM5]|nr:hypothetical protein OCAR_6405 [Afipia carboxidovorans OM5]